MGSFFWLNGVLVLWCGGHALNMNGLQFTFSFFKMDLAFL